MEFERLRQLEAEARKEKKKEAAEIARRERKLTELDAKITEMKKRLGTAYVDTDDSLDAMFVMVKQKEEQQRRIEELKKKRQVEEAKRQAEIEHLKMESEKKRISAIKEDIGKYNQIVFSPFGKDLKEAAWKSLADKYPESKGLDVGDIIGLMIKANVIKIISRDKQFIRYNTDFVYDKSTGLEWITGPDKDTTWGDAKRWVESLDVAGGGWRMPTREELKTLYKEGAGERDMTPVLKTTGWWVWSGETKSSSSAWGFNFFNGNEAWDDRDSAGNGRGFAVRSRR